MVALRVSLIPFGLGNRPGTKLAASITQPYITIHETANPARSANAEMHRTFTHGGGGKDSVSFHFVVDDKEAIQLLPLDEIGYHAGDGCDDYPEDVGCFGSVAIETCVNAGSNWEQTLRNLEELCAAIILQDKRINFGDGRYKGKFSAVKIAQHNAWSGKNCPTKIRASGRWPSLLVNIAKLVNQEPEGDFAKPIPFPSWDGKDKFIKGARWIPIKRSVEVKKETLQRAWGSEDAPKSARNIKAGRLFDALYMVQGADEKWWYVTKDGFRILMSKCKEQFRPFKYEEE